MQDLAQNDLCSRKAANLFIQYDEDIELHCCLGESKNNKGDESDQKCNDSSIIDDVIDKFWRN